MSKPLNEVKVLKKLNIEDFRHLTKDKVIKMASMLDKMEPAVAKKALEQFPNFSVTTKEILNNYKDTLDKGLISNNESVQIYYKACSSLIEALKNQLESDTLSFEERKHVIDKMLEISRMMGEKDSENKKFITTMTLIAGVVAGVAAIALAAALGGGTQIEVNDPIFSKAGDDKDDDIDYWQ